jgi:ABC-type phosphate transport system substrate-binding protein
MSKNLFVAAVVLGGLANASAATTDEIVVIVNKDNDVKELSLEQLEAIFTLSQRQWNGGAGILAFNYEPGNPTRVEFDRVILHLSPEEVGRFWRDQRIRTGVHPPRQVTDPTLAMRLTTKMAAAIVYVPAGAVIPSVRIVARIRGGKVLAP